MVKHGKLVPTLNPGRLGVVAHDAEHISLASIVVDGAADGLAVDGQRAVARAVGLVPGHESGVELRQVGADQQAAHRRQAGRAVLTVTAAQAEALQYLPEANRRYAARAAAPSLT